MPISRVLIEQQPFSVSHSSASWPPNWGRGGVWPARWISVPQPSEQVVAAYKLEFSLESSENFRFHVSADERYDLFLNGERVGRGPERGDIEHWSFESYDCELTAGTHVLVARVWSQGDLAAIAQFSVHHGFLLCPEREELLPVLATGVAPWTAKVLNGYEWLPFLSAWGTGANVQVDGRQFDWGYEQGMGDGWSDVETLWEGARAGSQVEIAKQHRLEPAMLPAMLDEPRQGFQVRYISNVQAPTSEIPIRAADHIESESAGWQALLDGEKALQIPAHTTRRVLMDLGNYFCARHEVVLSSGRDARVRVHWGEGLYENLEDWAKGNRDEVDGKFFTTTWHKKDGVGDVFITDGEVNRHFEPLWWQAGRYIEIYVETDEQPLTIESFLLRETRYPLEWEGSFSNSDERLQGILPLMTRALQMCAHETYMDCPYYEQLMYVGDTRLEVLATYVLTRDDRLPKKALRLFDWSRLNSGLTQSRYPSRTRQIIPPFSLWWVTMCHDYALWRGEPAFTRSLLPGVRAVCDYFAGLINSQGLMEAPDGWNFVDWVVTSETQQKYYGGDPKWKSGVPPTGVLQVSGVLNWQAVLAFKAAGEVEAWFGEPELAALQLRRARELAEAVQTHLWNDERKLFADDLAHENWSEHAQCLAILSGFLDELRQNQVEEALFSAPDLARTTIYFSHYLLETCRVLGRMDEFWKKMELWFGLRANGLKTTIEMPEPTRSDCHAWGAHPFFHCYATIAGIRPTAPGFSRVEIKPQLGDLEWLEAQLVHPRGDIHVVARDGRIECSLPEGVERDSSC